MKNKSIFLASLITACLTGCTHLQQHKPLPPEGESAVRTTEEEVNTNAETPGMSPQEAQTDADVQIDF